VIVLIGVVVGGTTSAGAGRSTSEALLFGVGDSLAISSRATRWQLRHGLSSGGFSSWCER